jgi:hypothetical protein
MARRVLSLQEAAGTGKKVWTFIISSKDSLQPRHATVDRIIDMCLSKRLGEFDNCADLGWIQFASSSDLSRTVSRSLYNGHGIRTRLVIEEDKVLILRERLFQQVSELGKVFQADNLAFGEIGVG